MAFLTVRGTYPTVNPIIPLRVPGVYSQPMEDGIRFVQRSAISLPARHNPGEGQATPPEPVCAASAQLLNQVSWPDSEMLDGFSRMAARRKAIGVAWGEPAASWRKQIKVAK